jgi:hypothetical protein
MSLSNNWIPRRFSPAISLESARILAMRCAGMKWEGLRITVALVWSTEASTRRCFLRSHLSEAKQTQ